MAQEYVNPFKAKQLKEYGEDGLKYLNDSTILSKYIAKKGVASETSAATIRSRINRFALFAFKKYNHAPSFDDFLAHVKDGKPDPYELLSEYAAWLSKEGYKANQLRQLVRSAKKFLRSKIVGAKIDNDDFKENVDLPRQEFPEFEGTEKSQIVELLTGCKNQRLKTALMLFAAMGPRAIEGCAVRRMDVDYPNETITIRKEYAKMRKERTRPMTKELKAQLQLWEKIKYQPHQHVGRDKKRIWITPKPEPTDLLLAFWHLDKKPKPSGIYDSIYDEYEALTNLMKMERKNGRRVITFHRLRAFAKTTIANLGYGDFAEWFIGHTKDTYYRNNKKDTAEIFRKVEPYLTFMDVLGLEAKGADVESKLEASEERYHRLQEQSSLMMQYMMETDPKKKAAISRQLIEKGYLPKG
jgi:integrase